MTPAVVVPRHWTLRACPQAAGGRSGQTRHFRRSHQAQLHVRRLAGATTPGAHTSSSHTRGHTHRVPRCAHQPHKEAHRLKARVVPCMAHSSGASAGRVKHHMPQLNAVIMVWNNSPNSLARYTNAARSGLTATTDAAPQGAHIEACTRQAVASDRPSSLALPLPDSSRT